MGSTIGIALFNDQEAVDGVLRSIKEFEKEKLIDLQDLVVVIKDDQGKVKIKETTDFTTGRGAVTGGTLGFIVGLIIGGPIGGALLGAAAGALTAKKIDLGISKEKIQEVTEQMGNNSSALFLQIRSVKKEGLLATLIKDSGGEILEVELSDDAEADIKDALTDSVARH